MSIFDITLVLAASQTLFLCISAWIYQRRTYIGQLLIVFSLSTLAYLYFILMKQTSSTLEGYILARISFLIPGVIWLLAFALFQHEKKVPIYAWVLIGTYFFLKAYGTAYYNMHPEQLRFGLRHTLVHIVPQLINIGIYIHTLCLAGLEYKQDLIEERRQLRVSFVAVLGTFWLVVSLDVSFSVLLSGGLSAVYESSMAIQMARDILMFPTLLAVNLLLFRITNIGFGTVEAIESNRVTKEPGLEVYDSKDILIKDKLLDVMEREKIYCQSGLTIGYLAKHLSVQEYKLRSVINRMLKFNNFSQFLNKYRISDSENRLITTNDPIFNIGLDVGYTSLSSFHKAFKEAHGITPKEFRILNRKIESTNTLGKTPLFSL